ncbi:hypothetical protein QMM46_10615 [Clostridioides difficile]|nr:hypothetical protein [Clostridioides difficile]MDI7828017.1 hypothetical protein [Clostridioides difficile]
MEFILLNLIPLQSLFIIRAISSFGIGVLNVLYGFSISILSRDFSVIFVMLLLYLLVSFSIFQLSKKADLKYAWLSFIPILQSVNFYKLGGLSIPYMIVVSCLSIIPSIGTFINLYMTAYILIKISKTIIKRDGEPLLKHNDAVVIEVCISVLLIIFTLLNLFLTGKSIILLEYTLQFLSFYFIVYISVIAFSKNLKIE